MDAANRTGRWLLAAGLIASAGCASTAADRRSADRLSESEKNTPGWAEWHERQARDSGVGRGQVPPDPVPPVAGSPVAPDVQKAGFTAPPLSRVPDLLKDATPRVRVVALVGATNSVTDQEVIEAVRQRYNELAALDGHARKAREKELYAAELRRIVERELVIDEMYTKLKKAGKLAKIEEIKEYAGKAADHSLKNIRKAFGAGSEEEFLDLLRTQGLSRPVIRRQIERQFMADEYVKSVLQDKGRTPGLADVRAYYDAHPDEFRSDDKVKWLDIFISFNKHDTPRAAYDHAEAVRQKAAAGADFVALVKQFDNGLAVGTNGVGVGSKRGEIRPADVEPAVWALRPGEVSQLIEAPAGYHIVKVAEREYAGPRPFDAKLQGEVRDRLLQKYRAAEYERLVEDLWRKGGVMMIRQP